MSSRVREIGCRLPARTGRPGSVTSSRGPESSASSFSRARAARRASRASSTAVTTRFTASP